MHTHTHSHPTVTSFHPLTHTVMLTHTSTHALSQAPVLLHTHTRTHAHADPSSIRRLQGQCLTRHTGCGTQHGPPPGSPHVVTMAGREAHLYILQGQVFPAASSVNGKQRAFTRHQVEDAHDGPHSGVDAEADVVAEGERVGVEGGVCARAYRETHVTQTYHCNQGKAHSSAAVHSQGCAGSTSV